MTALADPLARIFVAALFLASGLSKSLDLQGTAAALAAKAPAMLAMPLALGAIGVEIAGAAALAIGFRARLAAGVLAAFTLIATLLFHGFWLLPEGAARDAQFFQFMKNVAIFGALTLLAAHGAGAWSIDARRQPKGRRRGP